jgi:hypothetical protein
MYSWTRNCRYFFSDCGVIGIFRWHAPHVRRRLILRPSSLTILRNFLRVRFSAACRGTAWTVSQVFSWSSRSSAEGCGRKAHRTDAEYSDTTAPRGRKRYYLLLAGCALIWRRAPQYSDVVRKGRDNRTS